MMSSQPTPCTKTLQSNNQCYQSVISFRTMYIFQVNALAALLVEHFQSVRHVSNVKLKINWGLFSCIFLFESVLTEFEASKVKLSKFSM